MSHFSWFLAIWLLRKRYLQFDHSLFYFFLCTITSFSCQYPTQWHQLLLQHQKLPLLLSLPKKPVAATTNHHSYTSNTMMSSNKPPAWRNSHAKMLLTKDIIDGSIEGVDAKRVFVMRSEYQLYKYSNFATNLRNLRKTVTKQQGLADDDEAAFAHDERLRLRVHNKPYPRWQGSVAERLLKQDIDNGRNLNMTPCEMKASRVEYGPYPGTIFRDHIHQELWARMERPYWLARRKEKEEEKKKNAKKKKQEILVHILY